MASPLLTTKLYVPPVRAELVSRPRLIARLNEGLRGRSARGRSAHEQSGYPHGVHERSDFACKLTLISAPAGFGKTTLLSEWIQAGVGSRE